MNINKIVEDIKIKKTLYQKKLDKYLIKIENLLKYDNNKIIPHLCNLLKDKKVKTYSNLTTSNRGYNRAKEIDILTHKKIKKHYKYLDIGCNDGSLTNKIAEYFKFEKHNVYGTDIKEWNGISNNCHIENMFYINADEPKLPYPDNFFDLITCFQVLHHSGNINMTISEIKRVLKKGGILVLREHDMNNYIDKEFIDFEHLLYICIEMNEHSFDKYIGMYKSKKEWRKLFGFKIDNSTSYNSLTNIYTDIMIK
jgi:ubiquinone/menaquinone biosynthesis C-methylase UbiE